MAAISGRASAELWRAAMRDAAGILATFITPEPMALTSMSVAPADADPISAFVFEIQRRLDLGRAMRFSDLVDGLAFHLTDVYRHGVFASRGVLRGRLHVPLYARELAHGRADRFPVVRAQRVIHTPENLLASEALRLSLTVARAWAGKPGAEGRLGASLLTTFTRAEADHPWAELRNLPRPPMSTLISIVRGRAVAGIIAADSPVLTICELFEAGTGSPVAFEVSAAALAFAATEDPRFGDRLFELLCLAWVVGGLEASCISSSHTPAALRQGGAEPVFSGRTRNLRVQVFFQTGQPLGRKRWHDRRTRRPLAAIPDILVEVESGEGKHFIIVDAKNRSKGSFSSVAYKMLGYRENIDARPFWGIAIFPSVSTRMEQHRVLVRGPHHITLVRLPLTGGGRTVRTLARRLLAHGE